MLERRGSPIVMLEDYLILFHISVTIKVLNRSILVTYSNRGGSIMRKKMLTVCLSAAMVMSLAACEEQENRLS